MQIIINDVKAGPAGLVVVKYMVEGQRGQIILPKRLAGVAEIEWGVQAAATVTAISRVAS